MKYWFSLVLLWGGLATATAPSLAEVYQNLTPEVRQQYDVLAQRLKPQLKPLERQVLRVANSNVAAAQKLAVLTNMQQQLEGWIGPSVQRYAVLLPLLYATKQAKHTVAQAMPITVPYQDHQIKAQFVITAAQPYQYNGLKTLVRGSTERGAFMAGEKVIIYFKQGGPQVTSLLEEVTDPGSAEQAWLLAENIDPTRFLGGAMMFIPQK